MTTNSPERKLFNKYRKSLIQTLGRKALYDSTIDKIGVKEFGSAWLGCNPSDQIKFKPYSYQIVNTDPHNKSGSHWLAMYQTKTKAYVFDSYGRPIPLLLKNLSKTSKQHGLGLGSTNAVPNMEQIGFTSEVCGHNSLAFLLTVRDLGITKARNI